MRLSGLALVSSIWVAAATAHAAGIQLIDVPVDAQSRNLTGAVWYPCASPDEKVRLHGLAVPGVKDCPIVGDKLPLVVISHGRTGWFGGHHDTAAALADAGFVAVAIDHPGDNAFDSSRVDDLSLAIERPADIKRLISFMVDTWSEGSKIDKDRIGFFGFSKGAYTGLAVIGGRPNFRRAVSLCSEGELTGPCDALATYEIPSETHTYDPRVKAAVLADPAMTFLFGPDDLNAITVPVEIWSSEYGGAGVTRESVAALSRKLPSRPDPRIVPSAAHWAFLAPCSSGQAKSNPRICADAPDFDRIAFHKEFNAELLVFFRKHLIDAGEP
jgi:predicted dienelactone hydrolase